ncbi:MAG: hypothetical protein K0S07_765 [Chlamydiales bacterium]|jgi:hypothetical protein|nr:hypothetical protein [Chlamydiales bacterium]
MRTVGDLISGNPELNNYGFLYERDTPISEVSCSIGKAIFVAQEIFSLATTLYMANLLFKLSGEGAAKFLGWSITIGFGSGSMYAQSLRQDFYRPETDLPSYYQSFLQKMKNKGELWAASKPIYKALQILKGPVLTGAVFTARCYLALNGKCMPLNTLVTGLFLLYYSFRAGCLTTEKLILGARKVHATIAPQFTALKNRFAL